MAKKKKEPIFKITQYQPNNEVTCSSILVEVGGLKILLDNGLLQDSKRTFKQLYIKNNEKIQSIPWKELDYQIISHSHYDHCHSAIAYANGFEGVTITTELTQLLSNCNMNDSYKINLKQVRCNGSNYSVYYCPEDILNANNNTRCYDYFTPIQLNEYVTLELLSASHLSGACMVYLTYKDSFTEKHLLYTGDITYKQKYNRPFTMNIKDKYHNDKKLKVDILLMESTYGLRDRNIPCEEDPIDFLEREIIENVVQRNKILYIPSFAIHRASVLKYYLYVIFNRNKIIQEANIPVYFCGKLMYDANEIIGRKEMNCYYDEEWKGKNECLRHNKFFDLTTIEEITHYCMNNSRKIVISSGGMYDKGFSIELSKYFIPNNRVYTLCCGYQAEGSVGWQIQQKQERVVIGNVSVTNSCEYGGVISSLSGHANHRGLIDFVKEIPNQSILKDIVLVHGTDNAKQELMEDLEKELSSNKKIHIIKQFEILKF